MGVFTKTEWLIQKSDGDNWVTLETCLSYHEAQARVESIREDGLSGVVRITKSESEIKPKIVTDVPLKKKGEGYGKK